MVPPPVAESGSYSRYFTVPRKDEVLRPILDLHFLNRSVRGLKFSTLAQTKSEDWWVTIYHKMHFSILPHWKFLRFAFGGKSLPIRFFLWPCTLTPRFHNSTTSKIG